MRLHNRYAFECNSLKLRNNDQNIEFMLMELFFEIGIFQFSFGSIREIQNQSGFGSLNLIRALKPFNSMTT